MLNFSSASLTLPDEVRESVNLDALNTLAKLFATEDLLIVHDPAASTAMFNTQSRTLVLPAWKDIPKVVYLLFTGHEIGHALWTPNDAFDNPLIPAAYKNRPGYKSVLNVTEDARIEKRVKRKYPGLRGDFIEGYGRLLRAGFFGVSIEDIVNAPNIADRLNVRFKLGSEHGAAIPFHNEEEVDFLERGYALETFEEAILLANDIYEYLVDNGHDDGEPGEGEPGENGEQGEEGEPGEKSSSGDDAGSESENADGESDGDADGNDDSDGGTITPNNDGDDSDSAAGSDDSDDDSSDGESDSDGSDSSDGDTSGNATPKKGGKKKSDSSDGVYDPSSRTDEASRKNAEELIDTSGVADNRVSIPFDRIDYKHFVHDTKKVLDDFKQVIDKKYSSDFSDSSRRAEFYNDLRAECKKYVSSCNPVVAYLAKEFEMRKAADEHRRSSSARTGVINVGKLHAYKYEEDLFLRKAILPDAKNHGLVMFIDLSGSMQSNMAGTLEQLINLVLFCKKVQIPFEVYGFGDAGSRNASNGEDSSEYVNHDVVIDETFYLRKYISSDLKPSEYRDALEYLFYMKSFWKTTISGYNNNDDDWFRKYYGNIPRNDNLGSTPMNDAIITAVGVVNDFRKKTGVQICNTVFLSDGESNPLYYYREVAEDGSVDHKPISPGYSRSRNVNSYLYDEKTRKTFHVGSTRGYGSDAYRAMTAFLLEGLANYCNVKVAGFYILSKHGSNAKSELASLMDLSETTIDEAYDTLKKDGVVVTGSPGYDAHFAIPGGKSLSTDEENILDGVEVGAKVSKIRAAFKKGSKKKIQSRVLLTKFIDLIA